MEPEEYASLLQPLRAVFDKLATRHGGEIVRIDGDGVAVIFGYPESHEDMGRRAVEMAIELHEEIRALSPSFPKISGELALHSGIDLGLILLRSGDSVRGRFEIIGNATNMAAHLCEAAAENEILVTEAALGGHRDLYISASHRAPNITDGEQENTVLKVMGRAPHDNRLTARNHGKAMPFFGRKKEMKELEKCLENCLSATPQLAMMIGPPGIGKSRLASNFLETVASQGASVHQAYCEGYLGASPFQPFAQLARSLVADLSGKESGDDGQWIQWLKRCNPAVRESLVNLLGLNAGKDGLAAALPENISTAMLYLTEQALLKRSNGLVFHIDDWQWVDDASQNAFLSFAKKARGSILLLMSSRVVDDSPFEALPPTVLLLESLSKSESMEAIKTLIQTPEPLLVEQIVANSGGNPLFIEELCHGLPHERPASPSSDHRSWLYSLVQARYARLPEKTAKLVRSAAAIGHMMPTFLFEEMTGIGEDSSMLSDLSARDFIYKSDVSGVLRFKHGITRDAIYDLIGVDEKKKLHRKIAELLEARVEVDRPNQHLDALAFHHGAAGDAQKALRYAIQAGDKALDGAALDRAQSHYKSAIEAIISLENADSLTDNVRRELIKTECKITKKFGQASVVDPSRDQLVVLERAVSRATDRDDLKDLAWAEYWLGFIHYGLGEPHPAIYHLERAVRVAQSVGLGHALATIRATLGQAQAAACNYNAALPLLDKSVAVGREQRNGSTPAIVLSYSLACRALIHADKGQFDHAYAGFDEAMKVLAGVEHEMTASVLTLRCAACLWQGHHEEAYDLAIYSQDIAERARARYIFVNCNSLAGYAKWCIEPDPQLLDNIVKATSWLENTGQQQFNSLNFGWLANSMVSLGRHTEAKKYAARAFLRARKGDRLGEAMAARAMARAAIDGETKRSARHYLAIASKSAEYRGSHHELAKNKLCKAELMPSQDNNAESQNMVAEAQGDFA